MTLLQALALFCAAVIGGTLNAVAGGGTFFTLPTLLFVGVPPVPANATSTVALWPGTIASVGAYRRELRLGVRTLVVYGIASAAGGIVGAQILLHTSGDLFLHMVPFLLLFSTLLFAFGGGITRRLRERIAKSADAKPYIADVQSTRPSFLVALAVFILALYGGFFGAGLGILLLAVLSFVGLGSIHAMNAVKTVLVTCINGVAVVTFILAGAIFWPQALVMILGAITGGYGGATLAQRVPQRYVRTFVIVVGFGVSIAFFVKYFL